jgi:hypothetical protein
MQKKKTIRKQEEARRTKKQRKMASLAVETAERRRRRRRESELELEREAGIAGLEEEEEQKQEQAEQAEEEQNQQKKRLKMTTAQELVVYAATNDIQNFRVAFDQAIKQKLSNFQFRSAINAAISTVSVDVLEFLTRSCVPANALARGRILINERDQYSELTSIIRANDIPTARFWMTRPRPDLCVEGQVLLLNNEMFVRGGQMRTDRWATYIQTPEMATVLVKATGGVLVENPRTLVMVLEGVAHQLVPFEAALKVLELSVERIRQIITDPHPVFTFNDFDTEVSNAFSAFNIIYQPAAASAFRALFESQLLEKIAPDEKDKEERQSTPTNALLRAFRHVIVQQDQAKRDALLDMLIQKYGADFMLVLARARSTEGTASLLRAVTPQLLAQTLKKTATKRAEWAAFVRAIIKSANPNFYVLKRALTLTQDSILLLERGSRERLLAEQLIVKLRERLLFFLSPRIAAIQQEVRAGRDIAELISVYEGYRISNFNSRRRR